MQESSVIEFSTYFSKATQQTIKSATGMKINISSTYQKVPNIMIAGDIGSFVSFKGDYNGILIMNFSGDAAVEIVTAYLKLMGMPDGDIPKNHTSDDVRNNIGEVVNQIIGKSRHLIQERYDLAAKANIPAVVPISTPIGLTLETAQTEGQECVRISMSTPSSKRFYIELSMEPTKLVEIKS
jgi:CheY-specific phosphatase CheX